MPHASAGIVDDRRNPDVRQPPEAGADVEPPMVGSGCCILDANHRARSDGPPREGVETPRKIEMPDASVVIVDVRKSPDTREDGGKLAAGPLIGGDSVIGEPGAGVEPPRQKLEVPDAAAGTVDVLQSPPGTGEDVGLVADSVVGQDPVLLDADAAPASVPDAERPPAEVVTATEGVVSIRVGYRPGDEVGGASPVDPPGSVCEQTV